MAVLRFSLHENVPLGTDTQTVPQKGQRYLRNNCELAFRVTQRHVWHKKVNAGKLRSDVNNLQVVWQPNIYWFELSEISSISVTSGGDRNRIGGPHVPLPLLT